MKKRFFCFLTVFCMAVELFAGINLISYSKNRNDVFAPTVIKNGEFKYYSNFTQKTASYNFFYDENWFDDSAEQFNIPLARMSIRVAMSAAESDDSDVKYMFEKLGFKNENALINYPVPTEETIGYAINSKEITGSDGVNYTLLMCAVRGGGYGKEWADNFNIGISGNHPGFATQAEKVSTAVADYVNAEQINTENLKIWITGFSRGAAVANIAGHSLSETYGNQDVYAYCFECPQSIMKSDNAVVDKNIFNVINDIDFVTYVAPEQWGFGRYGINCYVPSEAISQSRDSYSEAKRKMSQEYGRIYTAAVNGKINSAGNVFSYESPEREKQAKFIKDFYGALTGSLTREEAEDKLFPDVRRIISDSISSGGIVLQLDSINIENLFKTIISAAPGVLLSLVRNGEELNSVPELFEILLQSHYPELCLAWLDTVTGFEFVNEAEYKLTVLTESGLNS